MRAARQSRVPARVAVQAVDSQLGEALDSNSEYVNIEMNPAEAIWSCRVLSL